MTCRCPCKSSFQSKYLLQWVGIYRNLFQRPRIILLTAWVASMLKAYCRAHFKQSAHQPRQRLSGPTHNIIKSTDALGNVQTRVARRIQIAPLSLNPESPETTYTAVLNAVELSYIPEWILFESRHASWLKSEKSLMLAHCILWPFGMSGIHLIYVPYLIPIIEHICTRPLVSCGVCTGSYAARGRVPIRDMYAGPSSYCQTYIW